MTKIFSDEARKSGWYKKMNLVQDRMTGRLIGPQGNAILDVVARKTWGWQLEWAPISYSDFQRAFGQHRGTVARQLAHLQGRDYHGILSPFDPENAPLQSRTTRTAEKGAVRRTQIEYRLNPVYDEENISTLDVLEQDVRRTARRTLDVPLDAHIKKEETIKELPGGAAFAAPPDAFLTLRAKVPAKEGDPTMTGVRVKIIERARTR